MDYISNSNINQHGSDRDNLRNNRMLRAHSVIMCIYFLTLLITVFFDGSNAVFFLCIPGFIIYCLIFYMSFSVGHNLLWWLHYGFAIIYIVCFVLMFGWNSGAQYFIFTLLAMLFVAECGSTRRRVICTVILFLISMLLNGQACFHSPVCEIETATMHFFRLINFLAAFITSFSCLAFQMQIMKDMKEQLTITEEKLEHFISEDALTGLSNRRTIMQYIEKLTEQTETGEKSNICMAIGDIDSFSKINDRYGHDCGDIIIKQLAYQLSQHMKDKGKIARWGGEQFLFVFEHATGEDAYYYLTKMQQHIRSIDFAWNDESIDLTMTYGLMEYNPEKSIDYCIVEADKKMFMGKESGRNTIIY